MVRKEDIEILEVSVNRTASVFLGRQEVEHVFLNLDVRFFLFGFIDCNVTINQKIDFGLLPFHIANMINERIKPI